MHIDVVGDGRDANPRAPRGRVAGLALALLIPLADPVDAAPCDAVRVAAAAETGTPAPRRPRIGLVLSGGGARGAAHVGVLRVLEQMRVPVDCIAGTSMGAIVGASYASGTGIDEMEAVIDTMTSSDLYNETLPRRDQTIHRKKDDGDLFVGPELGIRDGGLKFPKGVVSGIRLEGVLRALARVEGAGHFDELPIPFRAVATDIGTGDMVVLDQGELPSVMRASMSVPGAIAPARIGDHVLLDGGLVRNLPVDVVRDMGADVVIAVNLGTPLMKQDDIASILGVTQQMINILSKQNVRVSLASLGEQDILVSPALGSYSATDFDHMRETVPIGEAAARQVAERLARLSLSPEDWAAYRAGRESKARNRTIVVDAIRFEGVERANPVVLAASMDTQPGLAVDATTVDHDMRRLYGRGDFEHVDYRLSSEDGRRVMTVDVQEKSWGPDYLRFGLALVADFPGDAYFNLGARYRRRWLNALGGEIRVDGQIGFVSRAASEFYQPLDVRGRFFVAPHVAYDRRPLDVYAERQRIARFLYTTTDFGLDVGTALAKYSEVRLGVIRRHVTGRLETGLPPFFTDDDITMVSPRLRVVFDQIDSLDFPRQGVAATLNVLEGRNDQRQRYTKVDFNAQAATSFGPHTLQAFAEAHGTISGEPAANDLVKFGGFRQLSGYRTGQLLATRLAFGSVAYLYRLRDQPVIGATYLGLSLEAARVRHINISGAPDGFLLAGSAFVGLDTPLGPLYLAFGHSRDGNNSAYVFLGRP